MTLAAVAPADTPPSEWRFVHPGYKAPAALLSEAQASGRTGWPVADLVHPALTMIYGRPYSRKSTLAMHLARAFGTAECLLGRAALNPANRLAAWVSVDQGAELQAIEHAVDLGFGGLCIEPQVTAEAMRQGRWSAIAQHWQSVNVGLVVVDDLRSLLPLGMDRPEQVQPVLAGLSELSRAVAVVVIHHTTKPGPQGFGGRMPLGSTMIEAHFRHQLLLEDVESKTKTKITITSNDRPSETLHADLNPTSCELSALVERGKRARDLDKLDRRARIVLGAGSLTRADGGRALANAGETTNPRAGQQMLDNLVSSGKLSLSERGFGEGPNLQRSGSG